MKKTIILSLTILAVRQKICAMQSAQQRPAQKSWIQRHPIFACFGVMALLGTGNSVSASDLQQEWLKEYNSAHLKAAENAKLSIETRSKLFTLGWAILHDGICYDPNPKYSIKADPNEDPDRCCELMKVGKLSYITYISTTDIVADCDKAKKDVPFWPRYQKREMLREYLDSHKTLDERTK